ncbi:MAG: DUF2341 domain-containing protein, partial [Verrucomicrobiaceae bacterium]
MPAPAPTPSLRCLLLTACCALFTLNGFAEEKSWWKPDWTIRKKITLDTSDKGAAITDAIGTTTVLVRLHEGNFQFGMAKEDGSDIRCVTEDDKTELATHLERYDSLMNEAFLWVKVPDVKPGAQVAFWLYYGNTAGELTKPADAKERYDADTTLVYHFSENNSAPTDASGNGNAADKAGTPVAGAQIGGGLRLTGQNTVTTAATPALQWVQGGNLTWSGWVKHTVLGPNAILFSRREGGNAFIIGANDGVPYVELNSGSGAQRTPAGQPLPVNMWKHLAVVVSGSQTTLYVDGELYGSVAAGLPALNSPCLTGKDTAGPNPTAAGFVGELDEMQIAKVARSAGFVKAAYISQSGVDKAAKLITETADEQAGAHEHDIIQEHVDLIVDISKSLTIDGWAVIIACTILALIGGL